MAASWRIESMVETNASKVVGAASAITCTLGYLPRLVVADRDAGDLVQASMDLAARLEPVEGSHPWERHEGR